MLKFDKRETLVRKVVVLKLEASENGTFLGRATLELEAPVAYLKDIWVEPAYRGSGVGNQLLTEAMNHAKRQGCAQLTCDPIAYEPRPDGRPGPSTEAAQNRLNAWYEKRGFFRINDEDIMLEFKL